ncbi:hypothetical protein NA56DRAFT_643937 [Hyaloscypha hepaticicola]|uniref:Uncharacterized protein n=1 Tax=Hyaloscypha hepaticicola TaxID=2082293 RepID=A0A2J6PWR9_9HELO|nr:hypothetical protein NA56DRAFT_647927 [Hyaloscypha hepaticicola]PMD23874.1 hypothetical protein NA56DRAFT_643937 [Hyaloscypha hepaticicola]
MGLLPGAKGGGFTRYTGMEVLTGVTGRGEGFTGTDMRGEGEKGAVGRNDSGE